jgi:hypothetical protein
MSDDAHDDAATDAKDREAEKSSNQSGAEDQPPSCMKIKSSIPGTRHRPPASVHD